LIPSGGAGGGHDDEDEDWTLAICIRCAQMFKAALVACPYCADLVVTVRERADEVPPTWSCKIADAAGAPIAVFDGFASATDAQARAHEFVRRYVAQRLVQQRRP
jgi:hypothetical protein